MSKDHIFLIGFMGAGKSTVARALVRKMNCPLVEMDEQIVKEQGMTINEIFDRYGEAHFRDIESQFILGLCGREPSVISCGGGVPMRERNVAEMRKNGKVVLLTAKPETILDRVKDNHDRPLLENNKNVPFIAELMGKRREKYEAAADIIIETDGKNKLEICEEIIQKLLEE